MRTWIVALALALAGMGARAEELNVDSEHTRVTFEINHFGYSTFRGQFNEATGRISYDPAAKRGSADVTVAVASVATGVAKLGQHLQTPEFFDAAKHPNVTFKSTAFNFDGDELKSVDGNLTIRGTTKPVTLTVTAVACKPHPLGKYPACGADAEVKIKRSEYGVSGYLPAVGDEVTLRIGVEANNKPPGTNK